jgi:hypothetical protein
LLLAEGSRSCWGPAVPREQEVHGKHVPDCVVDDWDIGGSAGEELQEGTARRKKPPAQAVLFAPEHLSVISAGG